MENARSPITYFLHINGRLRSIVKQKEVSCIEQQVNKKIMCVPLEPQPGTNGISEVHKYYQHLVASESVNNLKEK